MYCSHTHESECSTGHEDEAEVRVAKRIKVATETVKAELSPGKAILETEAAFPRFGSRMLAVELLMAF